MVFEGIAGSVQLGPFVGINWSRTIPLPVSQFQPEVTMISNKLIIIPTGIVLKYEKTAYCFVAINQPDTLYVVTGCD